MIYSLASKTQLLTLIAFHLALYLPMIGHGLVFDDFRHLYSAAFQSLQYGLTRVQGGPFFDPLVWLTFKADWMLWGGRSFPMAAENLLLHVANIVMLYFLTLRLWQSQIAAWWAALGFALLFPANTWAVMYIATRGHVIGAFFYLGALIAALWYVHAMRHQVMTGIVVIVCAGLSVFAKESGVTVIAAVFIMLACERQSLKQKVFSRGDILLFIGLAGVLAVYLGLRAQSGAVTPSAPDDNYSYALSLSRLGDNLLRYAWRTYGLLAIVACAIGASQYLRGVRPQLRLLTRRDVFLSMMLFAVTLGPFLLLSVRSATYSYLPGMAAALLLGAVARSLYAAPAKPRPLPVALTSLPIILVVASLMAFTIGQSLKWVLMGDVSRAVLDQIAAQQPQVKPNTSVVLKYSEADREHRFPDAFPGGVFRDAVRLLYRDPSLDGKIIRRGEPYSIGEASSEIQLEYIVVDRQPTIRMASRN